MDSGFAGPKGGPPASGRTNAKSKTRYYRNAMTGQSKTVTYIKLLLTALLRYSGGIENPMAILYLLSVLIAALLFRPLNALLQGLLTLFLYGGLVIGERMAFITPHVPLWPSSADLGTHKDWAFVLCGLGVLAAGVFGVLSLALPVSSRFEAPRTQ